VGGDTSTALVGWAIRATTAFLAAWEPTPSSALSEMAALMLPILAAMQL
jgi:hypothetical protein